jgi:hypothetical protein
MITIQSTTAIINEIKSTSTVDDAWGVATDHHYHEMPSISGLDRYEERENEVIFYDQGWSDGPAGGNTFRIVGK